MFHCQPQERSCGLESWFEARLHSRCCGCKAAAGDALTQEQEVKPQKKWCMKLISELRESIKKHCYHHQVIHKSETVVAQSFGIRFNDDNVDADFRGKYTFSRFKDGDCIVIVWVAACEPSS
ncbi:hypothetical protein GQ600_20276 [Phytophthora cactorum]|nr:hypothetical protein GQ600_20276 [Phytophthora cactorum]